MINCGIVDDDERNNHEVLFEGRFYEWWCLKEGSAASLSSLKNILNSQVCFINNNRALVIVCNAILVDEQVIEVNVH